MMQLIRFHFSIEVATKKGNVIKYSHDGERANGSQLKDAADIREVFEEALRIAFPTIEPDSKEDENVPAGAGILEASSEHFEKAQILEVPKTKKLEKVPLSQETKKEILQLAEMGLRPKEIASDLPNPLKGIGFCLRKKSGTRSAGSHRVASPRGFIDFSQPGSLSRKESLTPFCRHGNTCSSQVVTNLMLSETIDPRSPSFSGRFESRVPYLFRFRRGVNLLLERCLEAMQILSSMVYIVDYSNRGRNSSHPLKGVGLLEPQRYKLGIRDARQVVGTIIAKTPQRKPIGKEDNQSSEGPPEIPEAVEDSTAAAEAEKEVIEEVDPKPPIEEGDSSREDSGEIPGVPRGEMGGQEETGVREDVPLEVVSYSPAVVGGEIWDLARAGLGPAEIAEKLQERGILFSEDMVKRRLKKIQAGAA